MIGFVDEICEGFLPKIGHDGRMTQVLLNIALQSTALRQGSPDCEQVSRLFICLRDASLPARVPQGNPELRGSLHLEHPFTYSLVVAVAISDTYTPLHEHSASVGALLSRQLPGQKW